MRFILFIIGLILSADGLYYAAVTSMGAGEALTVTVGIVFILWSVFYDAARKKGFLKFLKRLFVFFMTVLVLYSCAICVIGKMDNATYTEDYIIVLGAGLNGNEPSLVLAKRLDKAVEYLNNNNNAIAVVSGGQGKGETVSEALAMENYLIEHGISDERIIREEDSSNTYENFEYSKLAAGEGRVVFVTSDFHVIRSMQMAKINGIDATHIGASTPISLLPVSCIREAAAQIASIRYYLD